MRSRAFGRLGWQVGEIGCGTRGVTGWSTPDPADSRTLQLAADLGVTFFDTAWLYGRGRAEALLGRLVRDNPDRRIRVATKIPPRDHAFPSTRSSAADDIYPRDHVIEYLDLSLRALGTGHIDLLQFHVWQDSWIHDERWLATLDALRSSGLVGGIGISLNPGDPRGGIEAVRSGLIDSVQVAYHLGDRTAQDELFPACREHGVAVIARTPFAGGALAGNALGGRTAHEAWFPGPRDPRTAERRAAAAADLAEVAGPALAPAHLALRFVLSNQDVSTVVPGMRHPGHVRANIAAGQAGPLPGDVLERLRGYRGNREPTPWSQ